MDGGTVLISIAQIALGGGAVQVGVRLFTSLHRRLSKTDQRKENVSTDSTSVQTADSVLIMVRGELQRLSDQRAAERKEWDTERLATTQSLENATREVQRANTEIARLKSDLSIVQAQLTQRGDPGPSRHGNVSDYDWRKGP